MTNLKYRDTQDNRKKAWVVGVIILLACLSGSLLYPLQQFVYGLEDTVLVTSDTVSFVSDIAVTKDGSDNKNVYTVFRSGSDVAIQKSSDAGDSFGNPDGLSSGGFSNNPKIVALPSEDGNSDKVFVIWENSDNVFFTNSTDSGATFNGGTGDPGSATQLSASSTVTASSSQLAAETNSTGFTNVYVVWKQSDGIYLISSSDGGMTFPLDPQAVSSDSSSTDPQIAIASSATSTNLYVVYQRGGTIYLRTSADAGASFGAEQSVSGNARLPQVAASPNGDVYITWVDGTTLNDIFFKAITDGGTNFDNGVIPISKNDRTSTSPRIAVTSAGNDVYITWRDNYLGLYNTNSFEAFSAHSSNGGDSFACPINLSNTPYASEDNIASASNIRLALTHDITGSIADPYITWQEDSHQSPPQHADILLQKNVDYEAPFVTIDFVNNTIASGTADPPTVNSIYWGEIIAVNGSLANAAVGDILNVNWGDGSTEPAEISSDGCSWFATHEYDAASSGTANPTVELVDGAHENNVRDTAETLSSTGNIAQVDVLPHPTRITMNEISGVVAGTNIKVKGSLTDDLEGSEIGGANISFTLTFANGSSITDADGNPINFVPDVTTFSNGTFVSEGPSPSIVADGWLVTANFLGNETYTGVPSDPASFDTTEHPPKTFTIEAEDIDADGNVLLPLPVSDTGFSFPASIDFHRVLTGGEVDVSECNVPPVPSTEIYPDPPILNICLRISIHDIQFDSDAFALVSMTYTSKLGSLSGYNESQIDAFHERILLGADIVDVTQSRSLTSHSVTANITEFGKVFAEIAVFPDKVPNALRQQLLLGHNEISLRNIGNTGGVSATITVSAANEIGDTAHVTINDPEANIDPSSMNTINSIVFSTSDNETGTSITLTESELNSGIFEGTFVLTSGPSSPGFLHVSAGDQIFVLYDASHGRMKATIDGVIFAGKVEVQDYIVEPSAVFTAVGGAVDLQFVGSVGLSPTDGKINVTISYANLFFGENVPEVLKLYHKDPALADEQHRIDGWAIISTSEGLNKDHKTITGETTVPGPFAIGFEGGSKGGSGGGLGRAGAGIVVDFVASLKHPRSTGGGSGGGGPAVDITAYPASYFVLNPLFKIQVMATTILDAPGNHVTEAIAGQQVSISSSFKNYQQESQQYAYIVTVTDKDGVTIDISSQSGTIAADQTLELSKSWVPEHTGVYAIKIFIWDSINNSPMPLSAFTLRNISVVES